MAGRNLWGRLLEQTKHEYSPKQRYLTLVFAAIVFLILLPIGLIALGGEIDRWLNFPKLIFQPLNLIFGVLLIVIGWFLGLWSNYVQFTIGRGTPVPLMATQKLIIQPPYTYCRNPMALGAIVMYLGVATLLGSIGAVILVILGAAALLTYIKVLEEKEMELRFGAEYLTYRQRTPFLFPRFSRKAWD